jgi:hypothetical protein
MLSRIQVEKLSEEEVKNTRQFIYRFCSEVLRTRKSSNWIEKHFLENNAEWLNKDFVIFPEALANVSGNFPSTSVVGRPQISSAKLPKELMRKDPTGM